MWFGAALPSRQQIKVDDSVYYRGLCRDNQNQSQLSSFQDFAKHRSSPKICTTIHFWYLDREIILGERADESPKRGVGAGWGGARLQRRSGCLPLRMLLQWKWRRSILLLGLFMLVRSLVRRRLCFGAGKVRSKAHRTFFLFFHLVRTRAAADSSLVGAPFVVLNVV